MEASTRRPLTAWRERTRGPSSPPEGGVAAETGLTPVRALLDHRQARFTQQLLARPVGRKLRPRGDHGTAGRSPHRQTRGDRIPPGGGEGRGAAVGRFRIFPGRIVVKEKGEALRVAKRLGRKRGTIWPDGSRLDDGKVGRVGSVVGGGPRPTALDGV